MKMDGSLAWEGGERAPDLCQCRRRSKGEDRTVANALLAILIADDSEDDRELIRRSLSGAGLTCQFQETGNVQGALLACEERVFDCVILDYRFGGEDGLTGLALLRHRFPHTPVIMVTGQGDEMIATGAMMAGAADYIPKSRISRTSMKRIIENAIEKAALRRRVAEQQEALANFSHMLAHDLKAPLSAVVGFAALLQRGLSEGDMRSGAVLCGRIESAARRMCMLIDTLRAYTKVESSVAFEPVSTAQLLEDALANLSQIMEERPAQVTSRDLPVLNGNAPLLTNLLQNLIANSIKFCEAEIARVDIAASRQGDCWLFAVKDNGIGIPEAARNEIFEPFTRLDRRGRYEGTGLGLATCKRIVERHQGAIWCESNPGEGTTIFFTLPGATHDGLERHRPSGENNRHRSCLDARGNELASEAI